MERRLVRYVDIPLLLAVAGLIGFGLVAIYSATGTGPQPLYYVQRQAIWALVGFAALSTVIAVDYRVLARWNRALYFAALAILFIIFILGRLPDGHVLARFVSDRWLVVGPLRFQPSEIAKVFIILTLARHLQEKSDLDTWRGLISPFLHIAPPAALIMLQPDLGTALVLIAIAMGMLYFAGAQPKHLLILGASGTALFVLVAWASLNDLLPFKLLRPYQLRRLTAFLDPYADPTGEGWNLIQSMIAIGSGSLTGKGWFQGTQTHLDWVPEHHTDFIFSVIGEEFGFVGGVVLLSLFGLLIWRCLVILTAAKDRFGVLIVAGVISMLLFHITVNIGMTIGLMPITGVPLPFISVGGSSLLINLISIGLVLNVSMRRKKIQF